MTSGQDKHPGPATLQAYAAGEVDPAQRNAIEAHLDACAACRKGLEGVRAIRDVLGQMSSPPAIGELSWRRIRERVRADLHREQTFDETSGLGIAPRRLITAGLAAAAAIALLVWFAPRPARWAPAPEVAAARNLPTISSGASPFEVQLPSGPSLELSDHARVRVVRDVPAETDLELDRGKLTVRAPVGAKSTRVVSLKTPAFSVLARSDDFTVGFWASEAFVSVRKGRVEVAGGSFGSGAVLHAGDRRVVPILNVSGDVLEPPDAITAVAPAAPPSPAGRPEPGELVVPGAPEPRPLAAARRSAVSPPRTPQVAPADPAEETRVEVIAPPRDPITERWLAASDAFYRERHPERAIALAEAIIAEAGERQEARLALDLLCEAFVSTGRAGDAVKSCERLLAIAPDTEHERQTHYRLGHIHADQREDCRTAISHFSKAIVFGRSTLLDQEARLARARCAIEVGDFDSAQLDLDSIESSEEIMVQSAELETLRARLPRK